MKRIKPLTKVNVLPGVVQQGFFLDLLEKQLRNALQQVSAKGLKPQS